MLFNSQLFLVVFLPVVLAGYYAAARRRDLRMVWLLAASVVFYGAWDVRLVPLLAGSILLNWLTARLAGPRPRHWAFAAVIAVNLAILGVFKYADFVADGVAAIGGFTHQPWSIVLPLGISFFTFQQIAYLADLRAGRARAYRLLDYALFVAFFPQLVAGPIVRHNELIGQFAFDPLRPGLAERLSRGAVLVIIGLAKKMLVADPLARLIDPIYAQAAVGQGVATGDAWVAAIGFTLQIFFDFSAYTDMAIGLALMMGLSLPLNFDDPYRAVSIRDFWRRWHMTLSRFFRDYVYIPLGGSRHGFARQLAALAVTWSLTGLWHGAAWTFVAWGAIHGVALVVQILWRRLIGLAVPAVIGWALTMTVVIGAFVVFRAEGFAAAAAVLGALAGPVGGAGAPALVAVGDLWHLALAAALIWVPASHRLALERLAPSRAVALAAGVGFAALVLLAGGGPGQEFIYFQF